MRFRSASLAFLRAVEEINKDDVQVENKFAIGTHPFKFLIMHTHHSHEGLLNHQESTEKSSEGSRYP